MSARPFRFVLASSLRAILASRFLAGIICLTSASVLHITDGGLDLGPSVGLCGTLHQSVLFLDIHLVCLRKYGM